MKQAVLHRNVLCVALGLACTAMAYAENPTTVVVTGTQSSNNLSTHKQSRQLLDRQQVQDVHDLVRYEPGVGVTEGGRAGSNGFTMRGVDADRVAINIDGLAQGESRSSEGFRELFGRYGNFNTNRNETELENMSEVVIHQGADSLSSGSGALGGAVIFKTKSPSDYLNHGRNTYISLKTGYRSKDTSHFISMTAAARWKRLEGILVLTNRQGHQLKSFSHSSKTFKYSHNAPTGSDHIVVSNYSGIFRQIPDPQTSKLNSSLLKLVWHVNDNNDVQLTYEDYDKQVTTDELSNLWQTTLNTGESAKQALIRTDESWRQRFGVQYTNYRDSGPWDELKVNVDHQRIEMNTLTWEIPRNPKNPNQDKSMTTYRQLQQYLNQARIKADKSMMIGNNIFWDTTYAAGYSVYKNLNSNYEQEVYFSYPQYSPADKEETENLIQAKTKHFYGLWNNTFTLNEALRLHAGVRYDAYHNIPVPDEQFNQRIATAGLLKAKGDFAAFNFNLGVDWNLAPQWTLLAKYSTGFRAPTADEMWFSFPHPDFTVEANPKLKAEHAGNIELGLDWHTQISNVRLSLFQTNYRDFIDFVYMGITNPQIWSYAQHAYKQADYAAPTYQNLNQARAVIRGVSLQSRIAFDPWVQGAYSQFAFNYTTGHTSGHTPINAIEPFKGVLTLGYDAPSSRWGVATTMTYQQGKKAKDTIDSYADKSKPFPFVAKSKSYFLVDVNGYVNVNKYFTIRGGVYNLFNRHYFTWDRLRSVHDSGTVDVVGDAPQFIGIERFSAPGRNFAVSMQLKY